MYLWHCDIDGNYSMYSRGVENENYLRGVQEADAAGRVSSTSIVPAAYSGRWPHIHFEVHPTLAAATDVCATDGYSRGVAEMERASLDSDAVFRDGWDRQLATIDGDVTSGVAAAPTVAV